MTSESMTQHEVHESFFIMFILMLSHLSFTQLHDMTCKTMWTITESMMLTFSLSIMNQIHITAGIMVDLALKLNFFHIFIQAFSISILIEEWWSVKGKCLFQSFMVLLYTTLPIHDTPMRHVQTIMLLFWQQNLHECVGAMILCPLPCVRINLDILMECLNALLLGYSGIPPGC